jgi:uncharacterized protein YbcV (DUF1398 family)
MEPAIESIIRETLKASNEGRIHFGQVIDKLLEAGAESYSVDYRCGRVTYYMPCGKTLTLELEVAKTDIALEFNASGLKAAILGAQRGEIMYPEFKRISQEAGCIGYTVWIAGKHVTYYGRNGETHVEYFPK